MVTGDFINGAFEVLAGASILNHCRVLHKEKTVRGVSALSIVFFMCWGIWNLYYYPSLSQSLSFYGGIFVVFANSVYVIQIMHYRRRDALQKRYKQRAGFLGCCVFDVK